MADFDRRMARKSSFAHSLTVDLYIPAQGVDVPSTMTAPQNGMTAQHFRTADPQIGFT
jgi:hypothetical protein